MYSWYTCNYDNDNYYVDNKKLWEILWARMQYAIVEYIIKNRWYIINRAKKKKERKKGMLQPEDF